MDAIMIDNEVFYGNDTQDAIRHAIDRARALYRDGRVDEANRLHREALALARLFRTPGGAPLPRARRTA